MSTKAFTLRLPKELHEEVNRASGGRVSKFVREAIEQSLQRRRDAELDADVAALSGTPTDEELRAIRLAQAPIVEWLNEEFPYEWPEDAPR